MNNYKIRVNNEAESREAQELFFELGYKHKWDGAVVKESWNKARFVYAEDKILWSGNCSDDFAECNFQELTLPQLRDLVVLHRNDIDDANWETEGDDQIYEDSSGKSFIFREQGWDELQCHEMRQAMWEKTKSKPQTTDKEQGLISGADALRALADGEEVEYLYGKNNWLSVIEMQVMITAFTDSKFKFRLKPRTVKLEIEVPAPFDPKEGDSFWILSTNYDCGYIEIFVYRNDEQGKRLSQFGTWRTEAEIKIVVEQLRKLKEHSK